MIAIDAGIPIPTHRKNRKYPYPDLEVGESFVANDANHNAICAGVSRHGKLTGKTFTVRKTREGVRVWRTA